MGLCGDKKEEDPNAPPPEPGCFTKILNSRPVLGIQGFLSLYAVSLALIAYMQVGNTPFVQHVSCGEQCNGLEGPDLNNGFRQNREMLKQWGANRGSEDWYSAFFMGQSSVRACTTVEDDDASRDAWAKKVSGKNFAEIIDFDGRWSDFNKCSKSQLQASCNIRCGQNPAELERAGVTDCASDCGELFNTNMTNGWLWKYGIQPGGGAPPPSSADTNHTSDCLSCDFAADKVYCEAPEYRCRSLVSNGNENGTVQSVCQGQLGVTDRSGCDDVHRRLGQVHDGFVSPSGGENFTQSCRFNFTRFHFENQVPCEGTQVLSVMHTNIIVRFVLVSGVVAKLSAILGLYFQACSTPKDPDKRKNVRLSLCLATPAAMYLVCSKKVRKEVLENAPYKPPVTGCLPFYSLICSTWLLVGLLLLTIGTPISTATILQWSGVGMEIKSILMNLKSNFPSRYRQKYRTKMCGMEVPWPRVKEKDASASNVTVQMGA